MSDNINGQQVEFFSLPQNEQEYYELYVLGNEYKKPEFDDEFESELIGEEIL